MASASVDAPARAILHIDADTFFLAVHERNDPSLKGQTVALWQYNDVICASSAARRLGVKKHMTPSQARALLDPAGGKLVHAYWRDWPGPRIWYGPYNKASRQLFRALQAAVDVVAPLSIVERSSIDEAYVDVTRAAHGSVLEAEAIAKRLLEAVRASGLDLPLSVGVSENKLLAKLASNRAKATRADDAAGGVYAVCDAGAIEDVLSETAASKLPGLGSRKEALDAAGIQTVAQLRPHTPAALQQKLGLQEAAAQLASKRCWGIDNEPVRTVTPQSVSTTSWTARALLSEVARTTARGSNEDGLPVSCGGYVFEAHPRSTGKLKSDHSRVRWILLSLALDLEERLCHHALTFRERPTKLTVGWQQGTGTTGWDGSAYVAGGTGPVPHWERGATHSRQVNLPSGMFADVVAQGEEAAAAGSSRGGGGGGGIDDQLPAGLTLRSSVPYASSERAADGKEPPMPESATLFVVEDVDEQQSMLQQSSGYGKRVSQIVNRAGALLASWAKELPSDQQICHMELKATGFVGAPQGGASSLRTMLTKGVGSASSAAAVQPPTPAPAPAVRARNVEPSAPAPAPAPPPAANNDDELLDRSDAWQCRTCTLVNAATEPRCCACDEPRVAKKKRGGSPAAAGGSKHAKGVSPRIESFFR